MEVLVIDEKAPLPSRPKSEAPLADLSKAPATSANNKSRRGISRPQAPQSNMFG
jgi:hypothetical protein